MKNTLLFLALISLIMACSPQEETTKLDLDRYPESFQKVMEQHGGLAVWNAQQVLRFERVNSAGNEVHTIDLKSRQDKIESPDYALGYDGTQYWVKADTSFKRDPEFYHNLMFYFYAMPFVLADPGTYYIEKAPLEFEGKSYPGVAVSFGDDVGSSPKDDYIVYYNPETYQMEWLGYTATFFTQERKTKFSYIRYGGWSKFNEVLLPTKLTWYRTDEAGAITEARNSVNFENIELQTSPMPEGTFAPVAGAKISE